MFVLILDTGGRCFVRTQHELGVPAAQNQNPKWLPQVDSDS